MTGAGPASAICGGTRADEGVTGPQTDEERRCNERSLTEV